VYGGERPPKQKMNKNKNNQWKQMKRKRKKKKGKKGSHLRTSREITSLQDEKKKGKTSEDRVERVCQRKHSRK
jgi:hypothetical protein